MGTAETPLNSPHSPPPPPLFCPQATETPPHRGPPACNPNEALRQEIRLDQFEGGAHNGDSEKVLFSANSRRLRPFIVSSLPAFAAKQVERVT